MLIWIRVWRYLIAVVAMTFLAACGGGGGDVTPDPIPAIVAAPLAATVTDGQAAVFSVSVNLTSLMRYQWQRNAVDIPGATSATYTLAAPTIADNGAIFRVVVSNDSGSVTSAAAPLTVNPRTVAPVFISQPGSTVVQVGTAATFTVVASGTPAPSYQWQRDGVAISGATAAAYTLASPTVADNGARFTVVVTNSAGSFTSSPPAVLAVESLVLPPVITMQPQSAPVNDGSSLNFSVMATSTVPLTYQWRRTGTAINGATAATYRTPPLTLADSGTAYSVVVGNSAGSVTSSNAIVTVNAVAPVITAQPANIAVTAAATASFSVTVTGSTPITYQWRRNGTAINGATGFSYTTPAITSADNGAAFSVVASNAAGTVTSTAALLTVSTSSVLPSITSQPVLQTVTVGQRATFNVVASGTPVLTYQWRRGTADIAGATASTYTLATTTLADSGATFSVRVGNSVGAVTSNSVVLTVQSVPPGATATVCFNPARYQVGFSETQNYRSTETTFGLPPDIGTFTVTAVVTGTAIVAGLNTVRTRVTENDNGEVSLRADYDAVSGSRLLSPRFENLNSSGAVTDTVSNDPPFVVDFGLVAGQRYSQTIVETTVTNPPTGDMVVTYTATTEFVGFETVTVPAGTFVGACRFKVTQSLGLPGAEVTTDVWVTVGSGALVRWENRTTLPGFSVGVELRELIGGSVAGVPLSGNPATGSALAANATTEVGGETGVSTAAGRNNVQRRFVDSQRRAWRQHFHSPLAR